jgi:lipid-A-disaccharide synthase
VRVAIVAGEASGDLLGAALVRALRERHPRVEFYGIAGPKMMGEGVRTLFPLEKLAVRGYVEALKHLPEIYRIRARLARRLLEDRPDLFIGVDAPDFNLGLEARLKSAGIPAVHYVGPSVWAWRAERLQHIHRSVDHMLVLFPFEEAIFRRARIPATYVGHPLADAMPLVPDREDARAQLRLAANAPSVVLLPGSRVSELEWHADLMIETARKLAAARAAMRFFVPLATRETRAYFESRLYALEARDLPITILFGHATLALHASDAALVASGTATLEAALARCPMVITYRVPALTYWLMKRKALLPYVGLPNILSGEFVVPELLQDEATPANLAQALANWLDTRQARDRLRERFGRLHVRLACDHDARVVEALQPYLEREPAHGANYDPRDRSAALRR